MMGAGRKVKTLKVTENSQHPLPENCSARARNLRKSDLGAVIFGCKHHTIKECYDKQLFGLPAPHFSYVRNIYSGLPLFLFNYSDRQLHGIFEASGHGQLNIDPCAWADDGSDHTRYPAQVKIRIRMQCQPLHEVQFRPLIAQNYYEPRLFWFELDLAQTHKLISLFQSSLITSTLPKSAPKRSTIFKVSTSTNLRQEGCETSTLGAQVTDSDQTNKDQEGISRQIKTLESLVNDKAGKDEDETVKMITSCGRSYSSVLQNMCTSVATSNQSDEEWGTSEGPSSAPGSWLLETDEVTESHKLEFASHCPNCRDSHLAAERNYTSLPQKTWSSLFKEGINSDVVKEVDDFKEQALVDFPVTTSYEKSQASVGPINEDVTKLYEEKYVQCSSFFTQTAEVILEADDGEDTEDVLSKLLREVKELRSSQSKHFLKINSLEQELGESKMKIQELNELCKTLETVSHSTVEHVEEEDLEAPVLDESILIVGGYDGSSWLTSLDLYSPSQDQMNKLSSMRIACSYTSVARLNSEVYVFGGAYGDMWHGKVESYNPEINQWVNRPSLNRRKGSLAGVSLNEKIFALGGGNGVECFSEVEMLDIDVGRWIPVQSMLHKRLAPAAADINGVVYVAGGFNGKDYLKSIERFDPREHSWTRLEDMTSRRGCHSMVVLNEKLYAIGGFDGARMVPNVEVFDPRFGSWMLGSSLNDSRGYSAAVVIGDAIYAIGGLTNNREILDTVECYKEGYGWQRTDLKAVGKRCMFSAIVH